MIFSFAEPSLPTKRFRSLACRFASGGWVRRNSAGRATRIPVANLQSVYPRAQAMNWWFARRVSRSRRAPSIRKLARTRKAGISECGLRTPCGKRGCQIRNSYGLQFRQPQGHRPESQNRQEKDLSFSHLPVHGRSANLSGYRTGAPGSQTLRYEHLIRVHSRNIGVEHRSEERRNYIALQKYL